MYSIPFGTKVGEEYKPNILGAYCNLGQGELKVLDKRDRGRFSLITDVLLISPLNYDKFKGLFDFDVNVQKMHNGLFSDFEIEEISIGYKKFINTAAMIIALTLFFSLDMQLFSILIGFLLAKSGILNLPNLPKLWA